MKKELSNYLPIVLFGLWPYISFLNYNQDDSLTYGVRIITYGLIYTGLLLLLAFGLNTFFKMGRPRQISAVLATGTAMFFIYLELSRYFSSWGLTLGTPRLLLWLAICITLMSLSWFISRNPRIFKMFNITGVVLIAMPLIQFGVFMLQSEGDTLDVSIKKNKAAIGAPNVYYFILDMYTREDILKTYLDYNNSSFIETLKTKKFFVANQAISNYPGTKYSLSSTLNMDYYLPVGKRIHPSMVDSRLQGFNNTVKYFRSLGYDYIHAETGGSSLKTRCGGIENICIKGKVNGAIGISEAEVGLLKLTPLFPVIRTLAPKLFSFDFTTPEDVISKINFQSKTPFFLFAHILSPHPPARYDKNCNIMGESKWSLLGDATKVYIERYINDIGCLNTSMLKVLDKIQKNDKSDPVIIFQGDHGVSVNMRKIDSSLSNIQNKVFKFPILHAMRLPKYCLHPHGHDFSSINTFRVVFNCIGPEKLALLPNKIYDKESSMLYKLDVSPNIELALH